MNEAPKKSEKSFGSKAGDFLVKALKFPFQLIMNLARLLNEIRAFIISVLTIIIVVIVLFILLFVFKPEPVWSQYKDFMNADLKLAELKVIKQSDIYELISNSKEDVYIVDLDEDQLTPIFRQAGIINEYSRIIVEKDSIVFYLNIDTEEKPLWLIVTTKVQESEELKVVAVGFKRMGLPGFVAAGLDSTMNSLLGVLAKQNGKDGAVVLFNQVLDQKQITNQAKLNSVTLEKGQAQLEFRK